LSSRTKLMIVIHQTALSESQQTFIGKQFHPFDQVLFVLYSYWKWKNSMWIETRLLSCSIQRLGKGWQRIRTSV